MTESAKPMQRNSVDGELTEEDRSKDAYFVQLAKLAEAMIESHGKEFAMGTLVLSARFIAENKPLIKTTQPVPN